MEKVEIVADTISGLPKEVAQEYGITLLPYYVCFKGKSIKEGEGFNRGEFFHKLREDKGDYPTTSHPTLQDVIDAYRSLSKRTSRIVHLTPPANLTKTYDMAHKAKEEFPNLRIEIIDTQVAMGHLGFLVMEAAKVARGGGDIRDILLRIAEVNPRCDFALIMDTLKYLERGGRIGKARALLGTLLSIKPIIGLRGGVVEAVGKVRTHQQGLEWIVNRIRPYIEKFKASKIEAIVEDIDNREWSQRALERLNKEFHIEKIWQGEANLIVGTHVGPGGWAVSWYVK